MKPSALIRDLRTFMPRDVNLSVLCRYIQSQLPEMRTEEGLPLRDVSDFRAFFEEAAQYAERADSPPREAQPAQPTRLRVTGPEIRRRWLSSDEICYRCGHLHQTDLECGEDMGGGQPCPCRMQRSA